MYVVTSCTLKSAGKRFKLTEREFSGSVAGMKTRTLANTPPPTSGFALFHEGGNIRALDANGKVHRLRPERGTPVHAAAAAATINPTGSDNSVTWTAASVGLAGNDISVTYVTPADSAETVVAAVGNDITMTPGTKARMVVTGTLTSDGSTPVTVSNLLFAGVDNGKAAFTDTGDTLNDYEIRWDGSKFYLYANGAYWESTADVATPDLVPSGAWHATTNPDAWKPQGSATGTPTVAAALPTAQQVIDAVEASTEASALVTVAANGTVTGAVAAVARTVLTGGVDATEGAAGDQLFDDDNRYLAISDVRKSSTSGWITEPYPS